MRINNTEYVNAQMEELKGTIDELASQIEPSITKGLVYIEVIHVPESHGVLTVWIKSDGTDREGRSQFIFEVVGGFNGGSGYSKRISTNINKSTRPKEIVSGYDEPFWSDASGAGRVDASLDENGVITIDVTGPVRGAVHISKGYST